MSETKKRTIDEIRKEYTDLCLKAGHTQYQIDTLTKDLGVINNTLRDLNFEAASVQAAEKTTTESEVKNA
jgi:uncharacterized coiled-coil DUF342 family protein